MRVLVVAVGLPDVPGQPVQRQVHLGHHVVEGTHGAVRVLVVAVGLPDVPGQPVQRQVHLG
ncbi:hypothetical protein D9C01_14010, partial [Corynebacterium diphtheriae]